MVDMVVAFASRLITTMRTHHADHADTPIWLSPALSSVVSMMAMLMVCPSLLIAAVLAHSTDGANNPI